MAVAIFYILYENYQKPFFFEKENNLTEGGRITLRLSEDVTFLNKANIQRALQLIPDNSHVTIDASKSINIHHNVIEIIEEFEVNAKERNVDVKIIDRRQKGLEDSPMKTFEASIKAYDMEPELAN